MREYIHYGLSVIPCRIDKRPLGAWKQAQQAITDPGDADAYGIVCGTVSGGLECIDYDAKGDPTDGRIWAEYRDLVDATMPGLMSRLLIQSTQSGGRHIIYRAPTVQGNQKLAAVKPPDAVFETRGEGGYFICAPSPGYEIMQGSYENIPTLTEDERDLLITAARTFQPDPAAEPDDINVERAQANTDTFLGGLSPLDDYDQRGDALELLKRHGWRAYYRQGDAVYLTRPGKGAGVSASWNKVPGRLYVFTSSTQFQPARTYKPSSIYGILEHGGDFRSAARALISEGYGRKGTRRPATRSTTTQKSEDLTDDEIVEFAWEGQYGDSKLYCRIVGDTVCYDSTAGVWYMFDTPEAPGHWAHDIKGLVLTHAIESLVGAYSYVLDRKRAEEQQAADEFLSTANDDRGASNRARKAANRATSVVELLSKRIASLRSLRYVRAVLELARPALAITGNEWDRDPMSLAVPNGVINLRTGELRQAMPSDYLRRIAATPYDPDATCPRWQRFVEEITGATDVAAYLQRLMGYAITGLTTEHVYPILWGADGRNGKDTFLNAIYAVLGSQVAKPVSPDTVIQTGRRNTGAATPELYDLMGCRLAWVNETEEGVTVKAAQIKALSGGTIIKCRPLHGNLIEFAPTHLMLLITNHKPNIPPHDTALWARIHLISFTQRFIEDPQKHNEHKADPRLKETLASEAKGILAWMVRGCTHWQAVGLQPPAGIKNDTSEYRRDSDTFRDWLEENCETGSSYKTKASVLYNNYRSYCQENGVHPVYPKTFGIRLIQEGFVQHKGTGGAREWIGVQIALSQAHVWGS